MVAPARVDMLSPFSPKWSTPKTTISNKRPTPNIPLVRISSRPCFRHPSHKLKTLVGTTKKSSQKWKASSSRKEAPRIGSIRIAIGNSRQCATHKKDRLIANRSIIAVNCRKSSPTRTKSLYWKFVVRSLLAKLDNGALDCRYKNLWYENHSNCQVDILSVLFIKILQWISAKVNELWLSW